MGYASLRVITPPAVEPVSLDDAKAHLRVDHDDEDTLIQGYISVARSKAEQFLNRALITQDLQFTLSPSQPPVHQLGLFVNPIIFIPPLTWQGLIGRPIALPMSPTQSIGAVTRRLWDGTTTTLTAGTDYFADATNEPGRVTLRNLGYPMGSDVAITYTAGYGDTPAAVPVLFVHAIKLILAFLYENRGDDGGEMPKAAASLMWYDRMVGFA